MMARKRTDMVHLKLRFPEYLRKQIEKEAKKTGRSLNGEIVHRLGQSFDIQLFIDASIEAAIKRTTK